MKEKTRTNSKSNMLKKQKGITLIALVVTIIILLILAGVAINAAIGENGLFSKSKEAVQKYKDAEKNESDVISSFVDSWKVEDLRKKITGNEENPTTLTIEGKDVVIPPKFTIAVDSGTTVSDGIVVVDKQGNEWVWIPCYVDEANKHGAEIKFDRYDFAVSQIDKSVCTEDIDVEGVLPTTSEEYQSINKYGGYYIARYEAGDKETTELGKKRGDEGTNIDIENGDANNTMVIKKEQAPYNYVTYAQSKSLAGALTSNYNGRAITKLCSSYGWDTALKFIEKKYSNYSTDSTGGNYASGQLKNTGDSESFCSIYDLGGNLWERTSETYSDDEHVRRGGSFGFDADVHPSGLRFWSGDSSSYNYFGFRPLLFIK